MTESIALDLRNLAYGGEAVGRHEGQVVFVPLGVPGERVRVRVTERRPRFLRAEILEVLEPSSERIVPPCPYYGDCGGCHLQHLSYAGQLAHKREVVAAQLARVAGLPEADVHPTLGMEVPWGYRNHVQLVVTPEGGLAYQALRSNRLVPVARCPIAARQVEELLQGLHVRPDQARRVILRAGVGTGQRLVLLEGGRGGGVVLPEGLSASCVHAPSRGRLRVLGGRDHYHERVLSRTYRVSATSFFQVNTRQAEHLVRLVDELLALQPHETLLDVYCGVGLFGLSLAHQVDQVYGVEEAPSAVRDARHNGRDRPNAAFIEGRAEQALARVPERVDAVVVDPPRAGCAPEVLQAIAARRPRRIAYVSCDPATMARDVARLSEVGYRLAYAQPVDMFPQTYHVETVVLMSSVDM